MTVQTAIPEGSVVAGLHGSEILNRLAVRVETRHPKIRPRTKKSSQNPQSNCYSNPCVQACDARKCVESDDSSSDEARVRAHTSLAY